MNRRSFFGFACGGVAAAPLALVGEKPVPSSKVAVATTAVSIGLNILPKSITVDVRGTSGDAHVREMVRRETSLILGNLNDRRRG